MNAMRHVVNSTNSRPVRRPIHKHKQERESVSSTSSYGSEFSGNAPGGRKRAMTLDGSDFDGSESGSSSGALAVPGTYTASRLMIIVRAAVIQSSGAFLGEGDRTTPPKQSNIQSEAIESMKKRV